MDFKSDIGEKYQHQSWELLWVTNMTEAGTARRLRLCKAFHHKRRDELFKWEYHPQNEMLHTSNIYLKHSSFCTSHPKAKEGKHFATTQNRTTQLFSLVNNNLRTAVTSGVSNPFYVSSLTFTEAFVSNMQDFVYVSFAYNH